MRIIAPYIVGLFFLCGPGSQAAFAQETSSQSDREKAALMGPVATIRLELTVFKFQNEKWVETERKVLQETEYDKPGKVVKQKTTPIDGDPVTCDYEYLYDEKKRAIERFCMDGATKRIEEKYTYEEDRFGNWTKQVTLVAEGTGFRPQHALFRKITYFN